MPIPMPVITQVMPSVSFAAGTIRSISPNAVMKVGEIATPLANRASASSGTLGTKRSGIVETATMPIATVNWRASVAFSLSAPKTRPTTSDPAA